MHAPSCIGTRDITVLRSSNFPHNLNKMQSPSFRFHGVSNKNKLWHHNITLYLRQIQMQGQSCIWETKYWPVIALVMIYMQEVIINGGSPKYPFKVWTGSKTFKLH